MSKSLVMSLLVLSAGCVLLLAGGIPYGGVPMVYRGGLMLLLSLVVLVLSLWGAWRLSHGGRARLVCGLLCAFLASAGALGAWYLFSLLVNFPGLAAAGSEAGPTVASLAGMLGFGCMGLVGVLFAGIFGFLAVRIMQRRLWLAALHLCVVVLLVGINLNYRSGESRVISVPVGGDQAAVTWLPADGAEPGFGLRIREFEVQYYEGAETYTLLRHEGGAWVPAGTPVRRGDDVVLGEERWPVAALSVGQGMNNRYLLLPGSPARLLLEATPAPVKLYRARCSIHTRGAQGDSVTEAELRVNHPIQAAGYMLYLMSYEPGRAGKPTALMLQLRYAPGRGLVIFSMLGIIMCTFGWAFSSKES